MASKAPRVFLLALLGVALALAGGGSVEAGLVGKGGWRPYAATRQLAATPSMLGLGTHRRRVLSSVSSSSLDPNRPACLSSCPAKGGSYTGGRGCQKAYQCNG